jgi:phage shock protein PspC (stress-responsive transcriptional regulator)
MKKTINVNLAGQPFIIDEPAFEILHHYFEALKEKFTNEEERKEILADIEARAAEVFVEKLGKTRSVVSEEDVNSLIAMMGKPEDIAGEADGTAPNQNATRSDTPGQGPSFVKGSGEKKLFRDPDNKKVGGVISGFCHYFGWGDPTWIRIAVVAIIALSMFASLGIGFPIVVIYFLLLIVVPEANTSAEKLQMRGEPVTIQNIEKEVREAMTTAGLSVNNMLKDQSLMGRILHVLLIVLKTISKIFSAILLFICACIMLVFLSVLFGYSSLSGVSLSDLGHLIISNDSIMLVFYIAATLVIIIPLIAVMYDMIRFLANSKVKNPVLKKGLWITWTVAIISLFIFVATVAKSFNAVESKSSKIALAMPSSGILHIQMADGNGRLLSGSNDDDENISGLKLFDVSPIKTENGFAFSDVKMEITTSPDTNYYMERIYSSRGSVSSEAFKNIEYIRYMASQDDTLLNLDNKFEIPKHGKWRVQSVKIKIYVPEGKRVSFANNIDNLPITVKNKDRDYDNDALKNETLQVQGGKLTCINCKETVVIENNDTDEDHDSSNTKINIKIKCKHKSR